MPQTATAHQCHTLPLYTKATHCHCTPWSHTTTTQKGHTQPLHPRVHITHTYHHHPLPCTMQHHCTQLKYTSRKAGVIKEDIDDIIVITDIIAKYGCYKWYNWYWRYKRYNWHNGLSPPMPLLTKKLLRNKNPKILDKRGYFFKKYKKKYEN